MSFKPEIQEYINEYCKKHLPDEEWLEKQFDFIKNINLKNRIIIEFKNARYIYKLFEGLNATDELLLAEVRLQILMYASIYETIIHYVIFDEYYKDEQIVKDLLTENRNKPYCIPPQSLNKISTELHHDGKDIIPCFKTKVKRDITKVRFEEKCGVAKELGILHDIELQDTKIDEDTGEQIDKIYLCDELNSIYEVRNAIHIHAELKKSIEYHLSMSKLAYKRMEPFIFQIKEKLKKDNKI